MARIFTQSRSILICAFLVMYILISGAWEEGANVEYKKHNQSSFIVVVDSKGGRNWIGFGFTEFQSNSNRNDFNFTPSELAASLSSDLI